MQLKLVLEDGSVFYGESCGACGAGGESGGEVVINTGMTGYQEVITDPSCHGQLVVMTYPLIGNCGVNSEDGESRRPFLSGLIVRQLCDHPSNWRSQEPLPVFLRRHHIVAISGADTRAIARLIRARGPLRGVIVPADTGDDVARDRAARVPPASSRDLVSGVTTKSPYILGSGGLVVVALDLGLKMSIARALVQLGCRVVVVPAPTTAEEIIAWKPQGIVFSNGPGDPAAAGYARETVSRLLGRVPLLGIGLGHQLLALACGARTCKMKFGHRGANHPVRDLRSGRVMITAQNHGYLVDEQSLPDDLQVICRNINDGSIEGLFCRRWNAVSYQFIPEASPGPGGAPDLLADFVRQLAV